MGRDERGMCRAEQLTGLVWRLGKEGDQKIPQRDEMQFDEQTAVQGYSMKYE